MPTCTPTICQKLGTPDGPSSGSPSGGYEIAPQMTCLMPSGSSTGMHSKARASHRPTRSKSASNKGFSSDQSGPSPSCQTASAPACS